jgi:uncharacterized protein YdeI (YjbR/CyaY-like superfamily)
MTDRSKKYFKDWNLFEKIWLITFTAVNIYLFFAWHDTLISLTAVYMDVDKEICLKRNETRANKVPAIAIHTLAKKFEPPTLEEGFTDILRFDENGKGKSS